MNGDKINNDKKEYLETGPVNEYIGNEGSKDPSSLSAFVPQSGDVNFEDLQERQIQECLEKSGQIDKHVRSNFEDKTVTECFASDEESGESIVYGSSDESNNGIASIRCRPPITDHKMQEQGISFRRSFGCNNEHPSTIFEVIKPHSLNTNQEKPSTSTDRIFLSQENLNKTKKQNLLNLKTSYDKKSSEENNLAPVIPSNSIFSTTQCAKTSNRPDVLGSSIGDGRFTINMSQSLKYHNKEVPVGRKYEDIIQSLNKAILDIDLNMNSSSNDNFSESSEISLERISVSDFDSSQENEDLPDIVSDVHLSSCPDSSSDNMKTLSESSEKLHLPQFSVSENRYTTKESSESFDCSGLTISDKRAHKDYYRKTSSLSKASSTSELHNYAAAYNYCNAEGISASDLLALPHRKFRSTNLAPISESNSSSKCEDQQMKKSRSLELTGRLSHGVRNVDGSNILDSSTSLSHQTKRTKGFSVLDLSNSLNYAADRLDLSPTVCSKYTQRKHKSCHSVNLSDSSSDETTSTNSRKRRQHRRRKNALSFCSSDSKLVIGNSELCNKANEEGVLSLSDSHKVLKRYHSARSMKIENDPLSIIHESKFSTNVTPETSEENRTSRKRLVSHSKVPEIETSEEGKENKKFKRSRSTEK